MDGATDVTSHWWRRGLLRRFEHRADGDADGYNPYTATPTNAHTARYDPTNNGTARTRPLT